MTKRLLTSNSPEAVALIRALGFKDLMVHSLEFKLTAGEAALISITTFVEVGTEDRFVECFRQFNLVPAAGSSEEEAK
jgi:hypothetical protein